ncbi:MAG TPA: orotate phosphoribosyltransferase [Thermoplasmatales archaeon]|nr:orotate phosphoribosyltransferase [Thermoplasmatales archaeon]
MELYGLCSICGKAGKMFSCRLCGKNVCSEHYDFASGMCITCSRKTI